MKHAKAVVLLVVLGLTPLAAYAQESLCPSIVETALSATSGACEGTGRNQTCYGNIMLEVEPQAGVEIAFSRQGDIVDVAAIRMLTLSSMDTDSGEWGVALMRVQANLPNTLPGQNVTLLLFGDVEIDNAVAPAAELVQFNVTASGNINIRSGPSTSAGILGGLAAGESVTANGRLEDGSWLRIERSDGSVGWVFAELVTSEEDVNTLAIVTPTDELAGEAQYAPMQAFYFRSGVGDAPCQEAPNSGILIQTPQGAGEINLVVNEVNITLGSTVFLQAQAPGEMTVNGIEDKARVEAFDMDQTVVAGTRVRVPLDEDRAASGPPGPLEPLDLQSVQSLPLQLLERPVSLPVPLTQAEIDALAASTQETFGDAPGDVVRCDTQANAVDPEVDIVETIVKRPANGDLIVEVRLAQPLASDFSFAVLILIRSGNEFKAYLWEIHDGVFRIGEVDPQTGQLVSGAQDGATIEHDRTAGVVSFTIPGADLPGPVDQVGIRSFHTPSRDVQPQPTHCDFAGPYDLPGALR